jgi:hypothetical protein
MLRVTCRCGEPLEVEPQGSDQDRIVCPRCSARIRVRRPERREEPAAGSGPFEPTDGFLRFYCPCGRRLKVRAAGRPEAGKCPDCGRIVPVADAAQSNAEGAGRSSRPDARTDEFTTQDLARIEQWASRWQAFHDRNTATSPAVGSTVSGSQPVALIDPGPLDPAGMYPPPSAVKMEAGLRVCPRCAKPVHLGANTCRDCGATVPRR